MKFCVQRMPNLPISIHYYVTNVQLFAQFCIDTCKNELSVTCTKLVQKWLLYRHVHLYIGNV